MADADDPVAALRVPRDLGQAAGLQVGPEGARCVRPDLADRGPLRGIDAESDDALEHFDELVEGALQL